MRPILLTLLMVIPAAAQERFFSLGVQGGVPAQTPLPTSDRIPFALGPTFNFRLLAPLSLQTGVLFRRLGENSYNGAFTGQGQSVTLLYSSQRGRATEIPILARYYVNSERRTWRPFVTGGASIRETSVRYRYSSSVLAGTPVTGSLLFPNYKRTEWNADPSAGIGVDFRTGRFHLEPEARYSYWSAGKNSPIRKNQVDFLLGFRF